MFNMICVQGLLWYRKSKKSGQSRQSRAWVQRPDGWVQFTGNDKEDPQDIGKPFYFNAYYRSFTSVISSEGTSDIWKCLIFQNVDGRDLFMTETNIQPVLYSTICQLQQHFYTFFLFIVESNRIRSRLMMDYTVFFGMPLLRRGLHRSMFLCSYIRVYDFREISLSKFVRCPFIHYKSDWTWCTRASSFQELKNKERD